MSPMQSALTEIYRRFHASVRLPTRLARRASAPLLISPHPQWSESELKLLIVGQETNGWDYIADEADPSFKQIRNFHDFCACKEGVHCMLRGYERFLYERYCGARNSAFWRAFRMLSKVAGEQQSVLWTNVFKI